MSAAQSIRHIYYVHAIDKDEFRKEEFVLVNTTQKEVFTKILSDQRARKIQEDENGKSVKGTCCLAYCLTCWAEDISDIGI